MSTEFITASQLFASAHGEACSGLNACFYCGAPADDRFSTREYLKDTFTNWGIVACPQSEFVCVGCVLSMQEKVDMPGREKAQKLRNFSWLLTRDSSAPLTKANLTEIREACLIPQEPPFAIVIAVSGQQHLVFRAPACHSREKVTVQLEAERVIYQPSRLRERLRLCGRLIAALGKPALAERFTPGSAFRIDQYWTDGADLLNEWERVSGEPLSRLALFLAPNMEQSRNEYRSDRAA